jgi:hypothetical protein
MTTRFISGGSNVIEAERMGLTAALQREWPSDGHFQACAGKWRNRRLTAGDLGQSPIVMSCFVVDLDAPGHLADEAWRAETAAKIAALPGSPFAYFTRGGARVIWLLQTPFIVGTQEDARTWKARYEAACDLLQREFGLEPDRSCSDWQRLFRLPNVVRDGVRQDFGMMGDAAAIGNFELPEAAAPSRNGRGTMHRRPLPEGQDRKRGDSSSSVTPRRPAPPNWPRPVVDRGILFDLLQARGDIVGERHDGSFVIVCPRDRFHTTGAAGDGSTLLYPPAVFGGPGAIHCFHAGCTDLRSAKEWRREIAGGNDESAGSVAFGSGRGAHAPPLTEAAP